jgi:hypothetical protein
MIEISHHADPFGVRSPDREIGTGGFARDQMRAKFVRKIKMSAFIKEMKILIGQKRRNFGHQARLSWVA